MKTCININANTAVLGLNSKLKFLRKTTRGQYWVSDEPKTVRKDNIMRKHASSHNNPARYGSCKTKEGRTKMCGCMVMRTLSSNVVIS